MSHTSIRVSTLRGDQKINFNVYVKINDKYILYLKDGDSFEGERLKRLKEKKLKKMFIIQDQEELYRKYLQQNIEAAYEGHSSKSLDVRSEIVQGAQQAQAEEVMENLGDEMAYVQAKEGVEKFFQFLEREEGAARHILNIENVDNNIAHHGVMVATLSQALARKSGVTDAKILQLMGLGALLHDLEHFHSQIPIAQKLDKLSETELKTYKDHPRMGAERAMDKKHFDQTVTHIIMQHEETIDGKGFPRGLVESQIDSLALFVGCANYADRLISFEGHARQEVAKQIVVSGIGRYPLDHLKKLSQILSTLVA